MSVIVVHSRTSGSSKNHIPLICFFWLLLAESTEQNGFVKTYTVMETQTHSTSVPMQQVLPETAVSQQSGVAGSCTFNISPVIVLG